MSVCSPGLPPAALRALGLCLAGAALLAGCASRGVPAQGFDGASAARARSVVLLTAEPGGAQRETRVWVVADSGVPVVRTSAGAWFSDVVRNRKLAVRVAGAEHLVRAELVTDEDEIRRIDTTFRDKYGLWDRLLNDFLVHDVPLLERRDLVVRLHPR